MSEDTTLQSLQIWDDAMLAARLLALDPQGLGGAVLSAPASLARDLWLQFFKGHCATETPWQKLPHSADESRILGGLDLSASLQSGKPVMQEGVLRQAHGGVLVCSMAERLPRRIVAHLTQVLDQGRVQIEREGLQATHDAEVALIALDESLAHEEETCAAALQDRLAFLIRLDDVSWRTVGIDPMSAAQVWALQDEGAEPAPSAQEFAQRRQQLLNIPLTEEHLEALCQTAAAFGITSLRAPLLAARAARALALLEERSQVQEQDIFDAARLVLAPRATRVPHSEAEPAQPDPSTDDSTSEAANDPAVQDMPPTEAAQAPETPPPDEALPPQEMQDLAVQAVQAILPFGLLALMAQQSQGARSAGAHKANASRSGEREQRAIKGRPVGVRPGMPGSGQRLSLIDTLRQAAPWQTLRRREISSSQQVPAGRVLLRRDDLRIMRHEQRKPSTTVFVVDASGSSALNRLSEAKGAVELLLADCYVRRDRVAVIGFRGKQAQLLLPPTRSLVRAKRSLSGLPGGGGTPIAQALIDTRILCEGLMRRGDSVTVVMLTDGRANVTLSGGPGREQAHAEALTAARELAAQQVKCLLVDTSPQPQAQGKAIAQAMKGRYVPLPQARAGELSSIVRLATAS